MGRERKIETRSHFQVLHLSNLEEIFADTYVKKNEGEKDWRKEENEGSVLDILHFQWL